MREPSPAGRLSPSRRSSPIIEESRASLDSNLSKSTIAVETSSLDSRNRRLPKARDELPPSASFGTRVLFHLKTYARFIGPGLMVSIAYMDPGNYSTGVQAGAAKQYALLFIVLLSTCIALYFQVLAVKLGSVTGMDLAANCRVHLPAWMGYILYFFAEAAIIATDIAEVIGTAIALNILLKIPLIAGCILTIVDVILVLLAYGSGKGMKAVRYLELVVGVLLLAVVICFCVLLAKIPTPDAGTLFRGFLPSHSLITDGGVYMAAGVMGATVMPHSLYLGSSLAIPRVREWDMKHGWDEAEKEIEEEVFYTPSVNAIQSALRYSAWEVAISLCTFAIFVNCSIIIVSGATLYGTEGADGADLYSIYDMLRDYLSKGAAVTFMVALLCSGQSAGVICTLAGQIVSEGHINWKMKPWIRRIITRLLAIVPCLIVVGVVGQKGLSTVLNWSQVVLTITLPFLASPLVYMTGRTAVMSVYRTSYEGDDDVTLEGQMAYKSFRNNWITSTFGALICIFICIVNVYLLVQIGIEGTP